jgi:pseudaminic acid synthase
MNGSKPLPTRREFGTGSPVFIVAELSANHHQSLDEAIRLVQSAAEAGADAVKLQSYTPETMTIDSNIERFQIHGTIWNGSNLFRLYDEAHTPWEWHPRLKSEAEACGLEFFSTPFDPTAVDFLETLGVGLYKIASFEVVDIPLLRRVGATGKPVIMSTGMARLDEIEEAVSALRSAGCPQLVLLKCTSAYPAPPEMVNLRTIPDLAQRFNLPVGLSDHTLGIAVPVAAVALGARVIEKHFTLSRRRPGPDSAFSLEPGEFRAMVEGVRLAECALGSVQYGPTAAEESSLAFRRSLFVVNDVKRGELFTAENVRSIRPSGGLHTRHLGEILGRQAATDIPRGTPLTWDHIADPEK